MITYDPLMFTMDLPKFIVSNQKEKSKVYMHKGFKMAMAVNLSLLSGPVVVFDTVHKIAWHWR